MQVRKTEDGKVYALCGCGRSPTGDCIGWHSLTEEQYKIKKDAWDLAQYQKEAEELWFSGGSCTGGRAE
jgi:hypothetical protein